MKRIDVTPVILIKVLLCGPAALAVLINSIGLLTGLIPFYSGELSFSGEKLITTAGGLGIASAILAAISLLVFVIILIMDLLESNTILFTVGGKKKPKNKIPKAEVHKS